MLQRNAADGLFTNPSNVKTQEMPIGPMPGQKGIRLAKKDGGSSLPEACFRRFNPGIPLLPLLFAEIKKEELGRFLPALFGFGACPFPQATKAPV